MSNVSEMTVEELERVLAEKKQQKADAERLRREAYVKLRTDLLNRMREQVNRTVEAVKMLSQFMNDEMGTFKEVMAEYGQLRDPFQMSYKLEGDGFRVFVKCNKIKRFDERADVAATRLLEFLQGWIQKSDRGADDPMYQLAMTLLERNKYGDLDYKSVSKCMNWRVGLMTRNMLRLCSCLRRVMWWRVRQRIIILRSGMSVGYGESWNQVLTVYNDVL